MLGLSNGIEYTGEDFIENPTPSDYSMSFDGVGDFLAITATSFPIELDGENLSISFWVKRDSDDGDASCILGHSATSSYKRLHFNADGDVLDIESDQNGQEAYAPVTADTNWHHCGFIWENNGSSDSVKLFVDGEEEVSSTLDTSNYLRLHCIAGNYNYGNERPNALDNLVIWVDRGITANDMKNAYKVGGFNGL